MPDYLYRLSFETFDRGMALAEASAWLNCPVEADYVIAGALTDITPCAYLAQALEILVRAPSFDELVARVRAAQLPFDGFSIDSAHTLDAPFEPAVEKMGSMGRARALANAMAGMPNLDAPTAALWAVQLPAACQDRHPDRWIFGRQVSRYTQGWSAHTHKPHSYSSAVKPRHARALVNIAVPSHLGGRTLLDPCCGAGTVLIEAAARGLSILGVDVGYKIVQAACGNLAHYGFPPDVIHADAGTLPELLRQRAIEHTGGTDEAPGGSPLPAEGFERFDGAVIDFPYGHFSPAEAGLYDKILAAVRPCVKRIVILTPKPASELLAKHGFHVLHACTAAKSRLVRHITLGE